MSNNSKIEWTETTWNFATGCSKVSPGCKFCYAERMAKRLQAMGQKKYSNGFNLTVHEYMIELPLNWKKPRLIFVNSMSDIFHKDIPEEIIQRVFETMNKAHWHIFQILTKRSNRLLEMDKKLGWTDNIWMGVTVENTDFAYRIDHLRETGARLKFVSMEPLIGPVSNLNLDEIDWIIAGGESGFNPRVIAENWVIEIRDKCLSCNVPFFFKQWGGRNKKKAGNLLEGKQWLQMPERYSSNGLLKEAR